MANPEHVRIVVDAETRQAISNISGFNREMGTMGTQVSKVDLTLIKFAAGLSLLRQGLNTAKRGLEFAREGAELSLARDQFDNLARSIGTTSDAILVRFREATSGMMSNAEMMNSASQIISLGLADNEQDVIRLARVVGELGWDMSQVILTFANDSKLRLDALGLSVEDVERRMKALEEQGYSTEKAFDLAVIEAGEDKIKLLGSSADTTLGSIKMLEAGWKDLTDIGKELIAKMLTPAIVAQAKFITEVKNGTPVLKAYISALERYLELKGLLPDEFGDVERAARSVHEELTSGVLVTNNYTAVMERLRAVYGPTAAQAEVLHEQIEAMTAGTNAAAERAQHFADAIARVGRVATNAAPQYDSFFDSINRNLPSQIASFLDDLTFAMAGGTQLQTAADVITQQLDQKKITPEQAKEFYSALFVETQELLVDIGSISDFEAASNIRDQLGVPLAEAKELMDGIVDATDIIKDVQSTITFNLQVTGSDLAMSIAENLFSGVINDATTINATYEAATRGGGQQSGANFVVPSGFPNDTFPLRVSSGERVLVQTPAQQEREPMGMGGTVVQVFLDGREIAHGARVLLGQDARHAFSAGGARVGV